MHPCNKESKSSPQPLTVTEEEVEQAILPLERVVFMKLMAHKALDRVRKASASREDLDDQKSTDYNSKRKSEYDLVDCTELSDSDSDKI